MPFNPKSLKNLKPSKKGHTNNPNGRPRKSFSIINTELQKKGIEKITKSDLINAYSLIFNSTEKELQSIATDKETPYAFRLIIGELNSAKTRSTALKDLRDYMFGRAVQQTEINAKIKTMSDLTDEELYEEARNLLGDPDEKE
jgi:hypothetical protein